MSEAILDKRRIADSFGRAAATYDQAAAFQRTVGRNLMHRLPDRFVPADVVDLGCGTGHFTRLLETRYGASVCGLDLAEGMLRYACRQSDHTRWVAADAERLPLRDASQDLIFSSLALQWCSDLQQALHETWRALRPGGYLAFNTLLDASLHELRDAWTTVDGFVHVNRFMTLETLQAHLCQAGFTFWHCEVERHVLCYEQLSDLTRELKAIGAHNVNAGRPGGLTGRSRLRALTEAYEAFRTGQGLPATYDVAQVILRKGPTR
ncbi:malonyl-CoA O-methyltransferase [Halopseudomonas xinjiangensis]|uniref:Malonyl-[acyl-carrier protein] O-methyltransferase n=1 Tax=Halopseudomonas xinjiangensis TaxID=487184 RepID=A0A1H1VP81_9GAMM|nr:malonyl-ACP O-methyltransferase BioC [Halopseudomonas xinjiangensis]SDS86734.1 malonyl-CoA O-methyltransferase [Halopseudomonas xinjiangensis]